MSKKKKDCSVCKMSKKKKDCSVNRPWEHKEKKGRIQVGGGEMYKLAIQ